jgi:hypothetical protein
MGQPALEGGNWPIPGAYCAMSEPQYEIFEATDGTFAVEVRGGDGSDVTTTKFDSKQDAIDWVTEQLRRLGVDERWPEATND